jgi:hypothetical protein
VDYQKSLFSGKQFHALMEEDVRDVLKDIYPFLWAAVVNPFDDLLDRRKRDDGFRILDEGQTAQWLRPQIVDQAKRIFHSDEDMKCYTRRQQVFFEYRDAISICFKKITKRRRKRGGSRLERSNYLTPQNREYWYQRRLEGFPDLPRIIVGYELIKEMTDIRILVGYPRSRQRGFQWTYEMPNQDRALARLAEEHQARTSRKDDDRAGLGFFVRPRRIVREGTANG